VRARADVVLLWRCDPRPEHPDLLPARLPAAAGGGARRFVRLGAVGFSEPGDLEALAALRALIRGRAPHLATVVDGASAGGIPVGALREAAAALASARHAAIVWDAGAVRGATGAAAALALALLARDLDDAPNVARAGDETASRPVIGRPRPVASGRRAVARPLGCGGNVAGALAALSSELGHARDLGPGGAADAVLLVGARVIGGREGGARTDDAGAGAPPAARPRVVLIGARVPDGLVAPDVFLPAAVPGLSGGGLWMRADGIAVPVLEALPRVVPLEEEILDALLARAAGTTP
jgi:hypothetical protein